MRDRKEREQIISGLCAKSDISYTLPGKHGFAFNAKNIVCCIRSTKYIQRMEYSIFWMLKTF